jgi:hypothetical protein
MTLVSRAASAANSSTVSWVDQQVTFTSGSMTIYATFRHPKDVTGLVPAVLLIAGSGPTDRNGNSSLIPGPVDTLNTLADWLSQDGVASLRYDKLGSGRTGLGPYAADPASIGISVYEQESRSALQFLAKEKVIDDRELGSSVTVRVPCSRSSWPPVTPGPLHPFTRWASSNP